jgi:hypothetical protein
MPNVQYMRTEVAKMMSKWFLIRDCLAGQDVIKSRQATYLPQPNASDKSNENKLRYQQYVERAVFYNVTQRTHGGLVGQVFRRDPVVKLPPELALLIEDVDGGGVSLDQQAKKTLGETLAYGRCALFVDYPEVDAPTTIEEQQNGFIRPIITLFEPWQIVNWRTRLVGGRKLLSLVVINELAEADDDGFEVKHIQQWRVLSLDAAGDYKVEIYGATDEGFTIRETTYPTDAVGNNLKEIPFVFVGSVNNDTTVDLPPLYDMAVLNIAHYRNSADYEESAYIVGQPTPVISGLTRDWVDEVFKKKPIQLGSRGAISLPVGGKAELLQASPNSMPLEAMTTKEKQMISLGAKLVEQSTVQRTATEARQEEASEASVLSSCAHNVSSAYEQALKFCAQFTSTTEVAIEYQLNTEFDLSRMNAVEIQQVVANWTSGAVTFAEMRNTLRKAGLTQVDEETALATIEKEVAIREKLTPAAKSSSNVTPAVQNS